MGEDSCAYVRNLMSEPGEFRSLLRSEINEVEVMLLIW